MRKLWIVLCLAFFAAAVHAQEQQPSPAPAPAVGTVVNVHVTASHVEPCWTTSCLFVDAVMDGKKYELRGVASYGRKSKVPDGAVLMPGDYQAKLTKVAESGSGLFFQVYSLLLPGGDTWEGTVSGVWE